ncbi:hypothetical protein OURE66S_00498 [Oligella ureolytica]
MIGLQATGDMSETVSIDSRCDCIFEFSISLFSLQFICLARTSFRCANSTLSIITVYTSSICKETNGIWFVYIFYKGVMSNITLVLMVSLPIVMFVSSFNNASGPMESVSRRRSLCSGFCLLDILLVMNRYEKEFIVKTIKEKVVKHGTN